MSSKVVNAKLVSAKNNLHKFDVGVKANQIPNDSALSKVILKGVTKHNLVRIVLIIGRATDPEAGDVVSTIDSRNVVYDAEKDEIVVDFFADSYKEDNTTQWADLDEETYEYIERPVQLQFPIGISSNSNVHIGVKIDKKRSKSVKPILICEYVQRRYPHKLRHAYIPKMHNNKHVMFEFDMGEVTVTRN